MKPDKLTINDLFQKERRYVVPLYQRAYVWTQHDQWEPLWDDVERHALACSESESAVSGRSHFLGAIVLNVSKLVGAGVARSEVIDGQQRLTTLQLLIAALRDYAVEIDSQYAPRLRRLTVNEDEKSGSEGCFKVWPTNADRKAFRTVLMAGSPSALKKALGSGASDPPRIPAAYLFFHERIRSFVEEGGTSTEAHERRMLGLVQALRTALQLVVIELEESDDPQIIFETLNARGQPLLPSDLIRNYLFLQAANEPTCNTDELYEEYWRRFDEERSAKPVNGEDRFWHIEERQGRLTRPRIDLFLFHYLVMQTERDLNIGQLFREFRDWRADQALGVEDLLKDIQDHAELFAQLISPIGSERLAVFARRLKSLDNSTVFPLLLYILSMPTHRLAPERRDQIVEDLESWLVRRFICQLTNKNYNRFFVGLLAKLKRAPADADLADLVRAELSRSNEATAVWPSDDTFLASWLSKELYARSRPDRSVMVLRAIEERIRTARNETIVWPDQLSVEHLLPQKGALADYPYADPMPSRADETNERCRLRIIHTVGNLTLLTRELNAVASNGPFPAKAEKIVADSDLRLNAWLRTDRPSEWSEASIIERGEELFGVAKNIWCRPPLNDSGEVEQEAPARGVWRFTDQALLQAKKRALVGALARREDIELRSRSSARFASSDGSVRAAVTVSKRYEERRAFPYWYAYHPEWDEFLGAASRGFVVFGCMDKDIGVVIPRDTFRLHLASMNTTVRRESGKMYWHIHLVERDGNLVLLLPKAESVVDLSPYLIELDAVTSESSREPAE